ncbi:hypothetical protein DPX16_1652 [Anabarilius grahami]|uniref:PiggyBac transposable element-derived protein domain-containing protein n=1 Tax=Anabarilius grahami TaxID=495550 RepID=A0A3N0YPU1_ANAGA|nr:hypothetical protein DPX16_1652 [Anabarilius grahami]
MVPEEVLEALNAMSDGESDGGENSDASWVGSASDGSSESDPEPPRKIRPTESVLQDRMATIVTQVCVTEPPAPVQEMGKDGTVWTVLKSGEGTGRHQAQNILSESAGPTPHARRNIQDKMTAFMCLCDRGMLQQIRECTVAEARRATEDTGRGELFSTKVLKSDKITLSVYQCKPRRNVTILSTQHQHVAISTDNKRKPETVTYYNRTKVGVDVLDQMARQYSVKGGTRRWPIAVFYNLLDLAAINACVLYRSCIENNIPRRDFMLQLAQELRAEWMASKVAPHVNMPLDAADQLRRMTCMVKSQCKQNKTFAKCLKCRNAVCGKCAVKVMNVCPNCV